MVDISNPDFVFLGIIEGPCNSRKDIDSVA